MRTVDADKLLGSFIESGQKNGMKHGCKLGENWLLDYNDIKAVIDDAPTVEERPKGEWIELPKALNYNELPCSCSACGHILSFCYGYPKSNFCPNCGADMRGENA